MARRLTLDEIRAKVQIIVNDSGLRTYARKVDANYGHLWAFLQQNAKPGPQLLRAMGYRRVQTEVYERVK